MRFVILIAIGLYSSLPVLRAEDKPDPRATVESALDHCIVLMEKKEYAKYIQDSIRPEDRKNHYPGATIEEIVKKVIASPKFEKECQEFLGVLKECKTKTPKYNDDKTEATFTDIKTQDTWHTITFEKQGNIWLLNSEKCESTNFDPAQGKKK